MFLLKPVWTGQDNTCSTHITVVSHVRSLNLSIILIVQGQAVLHYIELKVLNIDMIQSNLSSYFYKLGLTKFRTEIHSELGPIL